MSEFTKVQDSGQRETFSSGSVRDTRVGKGRFDLLPFRAMMRLAKHYELGAVKYGDRNWEKGQPVYRFIDSAIRHIFKWAIGMRDEDHLSAAAWNLLAIVEFEERRDAGIEVPDCVFNETENVCGNSPIGTGATDVTTTWGGSVLCKITGFARAVAATVKARLFRVTRK